MKFTDAVTVAGTRRRDDGYLVADARVARTGIQLYSGWEVGKPDMPVVRVYRPEDEVFAKDTLASFAHRPITNDHPAEAVTADNWRQHAVGQSGDEIARDGTFVRVPLMVADGATIKAIEDGKRELSAGYSAELDWTDGKTPEGEAYDAVQRNIRANHVAIVSRGRAGSEVRIGDDAGKKWGAAPITQTTADERIPDMPDNLRTVVVDGLSVSVTDQGAQAIDKLLKDRDTAQQALKDAETAHADAIKAKDEEIGTLKADKKKLEDAQPKPEQLDQMVADRAELVQIVQTIDSKIDVKGKSDTELRKAAVAARYGDDFVKDASDDQVAGMFKALAKDAADKKPDPYRDTIKTGSTNDDASNPDKAYQTMTDSLRNAWMGEPAKGAA